MGQIKSLGEAKDQAIKDLEVIREDMEAIKAGMGVIKALTAEIQEVLEEIKADMAETKALMAGLTMEETQVILGLLEAKEDLVEIKVGMEAQLKVLAMETMVDKEVKAIHIFNLRAMTQIPTRVFQT